MVERILSEIKAAKGFTDIVEMYGVKEKELDPSHYAGCSIGVAYLEGVENEEDFNRVRMYADKALYYVKEHGRNAYKVWGE